MDAVPVPELVLVLVVALLVMGAGALPRVLPIRRTAPRDIPPRHASDTGPLRARLIAPCVLIIGISIPLMLRMVPPNGVYGLRIPATQASPEVWYPANAFMGWALSIASVTSATVLVTLPETAGRWGLRAAFLAPLLGAVVASFVYVARLG